MRVNNISKYGGPNRQTAQFDSDVTPELIERYRRVKRELAARSKQESKRWYCDVEDCTGEPHEGFHWCEHDLVSDAHTPTCRHARASQCPPHGEDWFVWLLMAGRGFGKTRSGAEWLVNEARNNPGLSYGVIGRTTEQAREVCIEGESGLLAVLGLNITSYEYNRTTGEIKVPSGGTIYKYTAENPESLRGPNLAGVWCDELAAWRYEETWTHGLIPAVRIESGGKRPHVVVTTTPRKTKLLKRLVENRSTVVTRGNTFDNAANLSSEALLELRRTYEGTRIGRQELYGELLEDVPGALWTAETIERTRAVLVN